MRRNLDARIYFTSRGPEVSGNARANPYFYLVMKILCRLLDERFVDYGVFRKWIRVWVSDNGRYGFLLEVVFDETIASILIETPRHKVGFLKWVEPAVTRAFDDVLDHLAELFPELAPVSGKAKRKAQKEAFDHFNQLCLEHGYERPR